MKPQVLIAYALLAAVILAIVTGAVLGTHYFVRANTIQIGELHSESRSVDSEGASEVQATIISGIGQMYISGGAVDLLEVDFTSNVPEMHPFIRYTVDNGVGDLVMRPSAPTGIPDLSRISEYRNDWTVRLNDAMPLELDIVVGMGLGRFDLKGLSLTALGVEVGAGDATIDLRGDWERSFHTEINGGIGRTTVLLPKDVGVLAVADQSIGGLSVEGLEKQEEVFVNQAYGQSDVTLDIEANLGSGALNLVVLDEDAAYEEASDVEKEE